MNKKQEDAAGREKLLAAAKKARENAYAPYSGYRVGAALLTKEGRVFTGANVENASYSVTLCAERNALFAAVAAGERSFALLALFGGKGIVPCGACLQALAEFCPPDFPVVTPSGRWLLGELLPHAFSLPPKNANKAISEKE